jgi:hypothetical protein
VASPPASDVFDYNDAEWRKEEARRMHSERMKLLDEDLRRQTAAEKQAMDAMARQPVAQLAIPVAEDPGYLFTNSVAQHDIAAELRQQQEAQAQRQQSHMQAAAQLQFEREMLLEQRQRDKQLIDALQQQQLEAMRNSSSVAVMKPTTHYMPDSDQLHAATGGVPVPTANTRGVLPVSSTVASAYPAHPLAVTGGSPAVAADKSETQRLTAVIETLQKLLEHERERNEKLQRQLDERDRVAMEHMLADAEREQREIMMRVRMVEAISAYRKEDEMRAADDAEEAERTAAMLRGRMQGAHVPRHPLDDDD